MLINQVWNAHMSSKPSQDPVTQYTRILFSCSKGRQGQYHTSSVVIGRAHSRTCDCKVSLSIWNWTKFTILFMDNYLNWIEPLVFFFFKIQKPASSNPGHLCLTSSRFRVNNILDAERKPLKLYQGISQRPGFGWTGHNRDNSMEKMQRIKPSQKSDSYQIATANLKCSKQKKMLSSALENSCSSPIALIKLPSG